MDPPTLAHDHHRAFFGIDIEVMVTGASRLGKGELRRTLTLRLAVASMVGLTLAVSGIVRELMQTVTKQRRHSLCQIHFFTRRNPAQGLGAQLGQLGL